MVHACLHVRNCNVLVSKVSNYDFLFYYFGSLWPYGQLHHTQYQLPGVQEGVLAISIHHFGNCVVSAIS